MNGIPEKAYGLIEEVHKTKLTEREKLLMHTYYGVVVMLLEDENRWISVEERLPEQEGNYLVFYQIGHHDIVSFENDTWIASSPRGFTIEV